MSRPTQLCSVRMRRRPTTSIALSPNSDRRCALRRSATPRKRWPWSVSRLRRTSYALPWATASSFTDMAGSGVFGFDFVFVHRRTLAQARRCLHAEVAVHQVLHDRALRGEAFDGLAERERAHEVVEHAAVAAHQFDVGVAQRGRDDFRVLARHFLARFD